LCELHARDHAGHRDCGRALHVAVVLHQGPGEEVLRLAALGERIVGRIQGARRAHAVVDRVRARLVRAPDLHAAARGEAAHPGLDHADRKGGRDRGVDRVAARLEHRCTHFRGPPVLGRDHAAAR
jgi:hypothetical protein